MHRNFQHCVSKNVHSKQHAIDSITHRHNVCAIRHRIVFPSIARIRNCTCDRFFRFYSGGLAVALISDGESKSLAVKRARRELHTHTHTDSINHNGT